MPHSFLMIRHGPTRQNIEGVFMGRLDCELPPESLEAASDLREKLQFCGPTSIYSSPLLRCVTTASAIFPGHQLRIDERLIERDLGLWAGKAKNDVRKSYPQAFLPSGRLNPFFTPPNGESLATFSRRVVSFLQMSIQENGPHGTNVLVSHNGVIRLIRHLLEGLPIEHLFGVAEPHLNPVKLLCDLSDPIFKSRVIQVCGALEPL